MIVTNHVLGTDTLSAEEIVPTEEIRRHPDRMDQNEVATAEELRILREEVDRDRLYI